MDWVVDPSSHAAVRDLRHALREYLGRHAEQGSDLDGAELVFSELLTNAVRHASGALVWVSVEWSARRAQVEIHDLGPGFELDPTLPRDGTSEGHRGLYIASRLAHDLRVAAKGAGGSRVTATLPLERPVERSHDPSAAPGQGLPAPDEAASDGSFGKESFLRALVVELGQAVELQQGPDAMEAAVAQVGAGVGGRMEEEYRRARGIAGLLTREQIADLYVRLKAAIDGDFYVIEVDDRRIVLGNRACPFGEIVKRAPGLCRMTSSVFGGIAARNFGEATVVLEERIAVGDPGCRVTVWLGEPPAEQAEIGHRYRAPVSFSTPAGEDLSVPAGVKRSS